MTVQAVCPWQTEEVAASHPQPRLTTWAWYMNVSPQQRPLLFVLLQTLLNVGKQRATSQLYVYSEMTVFGKTHYILEFNLEVTEEETHTVHSLTHSLGDTLAECLVCRSVGESRHTNVEARPQGWKQSLNLLAVTVQSKLKLGKKKKGEHLYFWSALSHRKQTNDFSQPSCLHQQLFVKRWWIAPSKCYTILLEREN